jgi:hypothetical protein
MTGFELNRTEGKKSDPTAFDLEMARRLISALGEARLLDHRPNAGRWAVEFRRLRRHHPEREIEETLDWYVGRLRDRWTPKALRASSFREKYAQIRGAMDRSADDLEGVEPSDLARKVIRWAGDPIWPGDEKRDEGAMVQATLDFCRMFLAKMKRADGTKRGLGEHLACSMGDAGEFAVAWLEAVHRTAWECDGWGGRLRRHAASIRSERFRRLLDGWLREWRGPGDWLPLVEEMMR